MWRTFSASRAALIALISATFALPAKADVAVGVLIPLSGKGASYGQQQQNAINMFMEKYAGIGGAAGKMKLVIYDTRGDNAEAISLTRKLIDADKWSRSSALNSARRRKWRFRSRCAERLR